MTAAPLAPDAPAMCPVCSVVLQPEWGNVNRLPCWRYPDHPIADTGQHQTAGYRCCESRAAVRDRDRRRAAALSGGEAKAA